MEPTTLHLLWVLAAGLLTAVALGLLIADRRAGHPALRRLGRVASLAVVALDLALVVYRSLTARPQYWPIKNNFDSVVLFSAMLGGLMFYLLVIGRQRRGSADAAQKSPARSMVDVLLLPLMLLCHVAAVAFYFEGFRQFKFEDIWHRMHLASLIVGSLFFAAAAAGGVFYLRADRALRRKQPGGLPSLERLESLIQHAVLLGFPLLTFGIITGVLMALRGDGHREWFVWPGIAKTVVAFGAWLIFAVVLHVRFVPRFRGRRAAWFSVAGFVLLVATYAIVQALPTL